MFPVLFLLPCLVIVQTGVPAMPAASKPNAAAKTRAAKTAPAKPRAAKVVPKPADAPLTDEQKVIYALGLSIYHSLAQFSLTPDELKVVQRAISDAAGKKPAVDIKEFGPKIQAFAGERAKQAAEKQKAASRAYIDTAAAELGAAKTESGLVYQELTPGAGAQPKATDTVKVNYRGTLIDGTEFDSSYERNEPATFPLAGVIRCWTEGLQLMRVGGKARLVCPSDLAYGDQGRPSIPGGATLVFDIELLDIVAEQKPAQ